MEWPIAHFEIDLPLTDPVDEAASLENLDPGRGDIVDRFCIEERYLDRSSL